MSNYSIINASNITLTGTLTIGETVFTGEGAVATPSNWATYPATSNLNMSNYSIINVSNIDAKSYTLNGQPFTGGGGGTPSNWAVYPASQNVNMSNYSITNVSNIEFNGILGVPSKSIIVLADGTNLTTFLNDIQQGSPFSITPGIIYDITYNNSLWIAGGATDGYTYYSIDGSNWTKNESSQTLQGGGNINNIIYADSKWIAVGTTIGYSSLGYTWAKSGNFTSPLMCIGYNGSRWVIGGEYGNGNELGDPDWTLAYTDNIISGTLTPIIFNGFSEKANRILYANNRWVAIGHDSNNGEIKYSDNGTTWSNAVNTCNLDQPFFATAEATALAYGNGYWLVGGKSYIYRSSDGINFSNLHAYGGNYDIYDIKYESGSTFYLTKHDGSTILTLEKSLNNGITWTIIDETTVNLGIYRMGISYTPGVGGTDNTLIGGGTLNTTTINATQINTSNLNLMGAPLSISSCNLLLYNTKPVNPVGAYIEIHSPASYFVTYPLYTGSTGISVDPTVENGLRAWWNTTLVDDSCVFSGISLLPNYNIKYDVDPLTNVSSNITNTSMFPIYIDLTPASVTGTLYYNLTPV